MSRPVILLHDPADSEHVQQRLLPALGTNPASALRWAPGCLDDLPDSALLVTWLDDDAVAQLLAAAANRDWLIGLLPHPRMLQARLGFGISADVDAAIADILDAGEGRHLDLLYCNDRVVLNSVVVADGFSMAPGTALEDDWRSRLQRFAQLFLRLGRLVPRPFSLTTRKEKRIDTAALGIVAVQHGRSNLLARRLLDDSHPNDGMLHALVLAPRSVLEILRFLLQSLLARRGSNAPLPPFVGHIKTASLQIGSGKPMEYRHDGALLSSPDIELSVSPKAISLCPGRHLELEDKTPEGKEGFRVQSLPTGESRLELITRNLPWIAHAGTGDFKDLFLQLRENARSSEAYLTLMVLSTLLATVGLFANSAPVIIGAMILAPLMAPIIAFAMGVLRQDGRLSVEAGTTLLMGIGLALGCSILLTLITPLRDVNSEIAARLSPTLLDLAVAVISGIAGAYAHARAEVARSLAGVAIAVALVPPLAVTGIGIGWGDWSVFYGAGLLFLTNLGGMVLAAALTFLCLGFSPFHLARRGLLTSTLLVVLISIPLALGFVHMVEERRTVQRLEGWQSGDIVLREVMVRRGEPLLVSARLLTRDAIDNETLDRVQRDLESQLQRRIALEATVVLQR